MLMFWKLNSDTVLANSPLKLQSMGADVSFFLISFSHVGDLSPTILSDH
jgi:hypothetical protein